MIVMGDISGETVKPFILELSQFRKQSPEETFTPQKTNIEPENEGFQKGISCPRNSIFSKKSPTGPTEQTPRPEYLIARPLNLLFTVSVGIRSHSIFDGFSGIMLTASWGVFRQIQLPPSTENA